jgi:hypothetical protein
MEKILRIEETTFKKQKTIGNHLMVSKSLPIYKLSKLVLATDNLVVKVLAVLLLMMKPKNLLVQN